MSSLGPVSNPYDIIYIDTVGGFSEYNLKTQSVISKQKYLHIAIDAHSRFVWIKTSKSQSASDFIDLIRQVSNVHPPKKVVTDRYSALKSKELKRFLKDNKIEIVHTPINHPSSNGMVERVNQTLVQRMRHKIFESKHEHKKLNRSWTTIAKECVREYNDTIHTITKFTPLYLLTGIDTHQLYSDTSLTENRKQAVINTSKSLKEVCERANRRRYNPIFEVGDKVYINITSKLNRGKLDPLFEGPFTIQQQISDHIYSVKSGKGEEKECHISQMKRAPPTTNFINVNQLVTHSTTPAYVLFLLTLLSTIHALPPYYETTSPYLWQKTNHKVSKNSSLVVISLLQKSPCNSHSELGRNTTETAINCNKLFQLYQQSIKSKCEQTEIFNLRNLYPLKARRDIPIALANNIINGINIPAITQDVTTEEKVIEYTKDYIGEIQLKILQLEGLEKYRTVQSKNEIKLINGSLERMQKIMNNKATKEDRKLILIKQELRYHIIFIKSFLDQFISGTFGNEFSYLFPNVKINTTTPSKYWKPLRCEWMKDSILVLKFSIPQLVEHIQVYKVIPFTLFRLKHEEICSYSYVDMKFIAIDRKENCLTPLYDFHPERRYDTISIQKIICPIHYQQKQKWKKNECKDKQTMLPENLIQVIIDEKFYYIYAPFQNITFDEKVVQNENAVYKVPTKINIQINGVPYNHIVSELNYTSDLNEEILEYLNVTSINKIHFKDLDTTKLDQYIENEEKFESIIDHPFSKFQPIKIIIMNQPKTWSILFISLTCIVIGWILHLKIKHKMALRERRIIENSRHLTNNTFPLV